MTNYYRLTKKELSFISDIQEPVLSLRGERLSRPVVVVALGDDIITVYTLSWYRYKVKNNLINPDYSYVIRSMF